MEESYRAKKYPDAINCSGQSNFTMISNDVLRCADISFKARGILALLLGNSDGWSTFMDALSNTFSKKDGRTSIQSGIRELEEFGFLKSLVYRDAKTKSIVGSFIAYTDKPFSFDLNEHISLAEKEGWEISLPPARREPKNGFPEIGKPTTNNTNRNNINYNSFSKEKQINQNNSSCEESSFSSDEENINPLDKNILSPRESIKRKDKPLDTSKKVTPSRVNLKQNSGSAATKEIVELWKALDHPKHREGTKLYRSIDKAIRKLAHGTFFNDTCLTSYHDQKFTEWQVKDVIKRFSLASHNLDYQPSPGSYKDHLKKVSLLKFFYNPDVKKEKSLFIKYFENPPELASNTTRKKADTDPALTSMVKRVFTDRVLGGVDVGDWDETADMKFILATEKLIDFFGRNSGRINKAYLNRGNIDKAEYLVESIISHIGESNMQKITPGYLCSDLTFKTRLPAYLNAQGILG